MELYLDSAHLEDIEKAAALGIVTGVTTNPSLLAKEAAGDYPKLIQKIVNLIDGPVSVESTKTSREEMIAQGEYFAAWHPNIVVKLPCTLAGVGACYALRKKGIRVNMTLCFTTNQALFAARAGAFLISPFVGRLNDISQDGLALIEEIAAVYHQHDLDTRILAASLREPRQLTEVALAGADIATCPWSVLEKALNHPLTDSGLEKFLQDAQGITL
jgi:transaldolase